jgi:hypothetical protein
MAITAKGLQQLGFTPLDDFVLQDNGNGAEIDEWNSDKPQPSIAEIELAHFAWENNYARKRKEEYPPMDELIVALWEGVVEERMASVTKLEIKRQAVKAKHPK